MDICVNRTEAASVQDREIEVVERKGLGHPDTICDALAEELSLALSRFYLEHFDLILHHNVDKVLLRGGSARPAFGGGEIDEPIEIYLAGRATRSVKGTHVPVDQLAGETCRRWFREHLPGLDADAHLKVHCLIRPGSADLVDLYMRQHRSGLWLANDTSIGVGYAPTSALERAVLGVEHRLNSPATHAAHPAIGQDVKVMGVRRGRRSELTVACAMIGRHLADLTAYERERQTVVHLVHEAAIGELTDGVAVVVNRADDLATGSVYLTVTGTSAEMGDDGQAGRGNRANGLITPYRRMTLESVAGKNPVTHVGKLYNLAATHIAEALLAQLPTLSEASCVLVSRIGEPVNEPQIVDIEVRCADGEPRTALAGAIRELARSELEGLGGLWRKLLSGEMRAY